MSCTSPFTVASTMVALPPGRPSPSWAPDRPRPPSWSRPTPSTKGSCISPVAKRSPTIFMPASRKSLTMVSGVWPPARASSRSASRPLRSPSMIRCSSRRSTVQPVRSSWPARRRHPLEQGGARTAGRNRRGGGRRSGRGRPPWPGRRSSTAAGSATRARWRRPDRRPRTRGGTPELRTCRAAGFSPKETLDRPTTVKTPGSSALIRRIPSIVSMPSLRLSSIPVERGRARASNMRSSGRKP